MNFTLMQRSAVLMSVQPEMNGLPYMRWQTADLSTLMVINGPWKD